MMSLLPFQSRLFTLKGKQRSLRPHLRCSPCVTDGETEAASGERLFCRSDLSSSQSPSTPDSSTPQPNPPRTGSGCLCPGHTQPPPSPQAKSLLGAQWRPQDLRAQGRDKPNSFLTFPLDHTPWRSPRRQATEGRQEQKTVPSMENSEETQPQEKRGLWQRPDPQVPALPSGGRSQRHPRASVQRLPGCTHLVFMSTALPPDRRPGFLCSDTSLRCALPTPPPPQLSLPPTCLELVLPSLLKDGVTPYTSHSSLCPLPEGSTMWEYSSDNGQQRFMILILCAPSKHGRPSAPPWAPPPPRD